MVKFWMCYVEGTKGCSKQHTKEDEARAEAERLLREPENFGKIVYLLETVGCVSFEQAPVKWE